MVVDEIGVFFTRPAKRTMVDDKIVGILYAETCSVEVFSACVFIAYPKAHVADDEVFGTSEVDFVFDDADAVTRSCLSGDGEVFRFAAYLRF